MTKLIDKDDPLWFGQTCDKPYDRHHYKLVQDTKEIIVKSWEEVKEHWWNTKSMNPPVVHVLDKPKKKSKGFA